jgi:hypothetical protein
MPAIVCVGANRNVRMIERGEHLRFTLEAGEPFGIGGEDLRQHFQGDPTEFGIPRAIHLAHAIRAEQGQDFMGAEPSTGCQCHE